MAVLRTEETVERVMHVIDTINHSGFPVVDEYEVEESEQHKQGKCKEEDSCTEKRKVTEESQVRVKCNGKTVVETINFLILNTLFVLCSSSLPTGDK